MITTIHIIDTDGEPITDGTYEYKGQCSLDDLSEILRLNGFMVEKGTFKIFVISDYLSGEDLRLILHTADYTEFHPLGDEAEVMALLPIYEVMAIRNPVPFEEFRTWRDILEETCKVPLNLRGSAKLVFVIRSLTNESEPVCWQFDETVGKAYIGDLIQILA